MDRDEGGDQPTDLPRRRGSPREHVCGASGCGGEAGEHRTIRIDGLIEADDDNNDVAAARGRHLWGRRTGLCDG